MRRLAAAAVALVALAAAAPAAHAHGDVLPGRTPPQNDPLNGTAGTSPNVDHVGWGPGEAFDMTAGGRRIGDYFYLSGLSHFSLYDVREPASPKLVSRVNFECRFENEDIAVDGRSLVFS